MSRLKYRVISTEEQCQEYIRILFELGELQGEERTSDVLDEIDLLQVLIFDWQGEPKRSVYELPFLHMYNQN